MASTFTITSSVIFFFLLSLLYSSVCNGRNIPDGQKNAPGVSFPLLLLDLRFKESSDLASRLVATTMDFRVELGLFVHDVIYEETTPEREERKAPCFQHLFGLPWYRKVKTDLSAHLEQVLTNLMKKDADLAKMFEKCRSSDQICIEAVKSKAVEEIKDFGNKELLSEMKTKDSYISNIKIEVERCLNKSI